MAAIFGGVPSRFSNYRAANAFPKHMHMEIYVECVNRGLQIAPELVGMPPDITDMAMRLIERINPAAAPRIAELLQASEASGAHGQLGQSEADAERASASEPSKTDAGLPGRRQTPGRAA